MVSSTITRRDAIRAVGAAGLAGVAGCLGGQGTETDNVSGTVKIGVMQPLSGDLVTYYGQQSLWGFYSGLAQRADADPLGKGKSKSGQYSYDIGDVTYELYVRDTKFAKDTAKQVATNLVSNQGVDLLFGCASSGSAIEVINSVVKQTDELPYVAGPAASAAITSAAETCHKRVFRASENTAMDARSGGKYVAQQTDVDKVYLFGADYSFGRAVVNNYKDVLTNEGVEIVGEKFVPRGHSEWEGLLQNAEDAGAGGIVGGFTVVTLPKLFTAFLQGDYSYRVFGGYATQATNAAMGQILQQALGKPLTKEKIKNANLGPFTTRYHWNQYDNDINSTFVDRYTSAYGFVPDLFTAGTFTAASAIDQAVNQAGSTDGADIASALRGMTVKETPKGENGYTFQEYNNQAQSAMTVADPVPTKDAFSDTWPAPVMPGTPKATIDAGTVTLPKSDVNCSL